MNHDNKRIAKNTLALFVRMCFIAVLGLIASRFMLQYLGETDFGIYNVVGGAVNLMAFFNIVLASATNRFLMIELGKGENGNVGKVFSTSVFIHALIGFAVIVLGETIGLYYVNHFLNVPFDRMGAAEICYHISLVTCAICVLQVPFQGLLISYENFTRYSVAQVAMMVGICLSSFAIGYIEGDRLIYFTILMALSQLLGFILYYCMSIKYKPQIIWKLDKKIGGQMMSFSGWATLGAASSMGKNQGSNLVLNYFFGPIVNSAFSIGNQVNTQISRLSENVSKSFSPQIMKNYVSGDFSHMITLMSSCCKYSFFLLYIVALPFFCKTEYILKLWLGNYPDYTVTFCNIIMINILLTSLSQGLYPAVQATGKIKWFQICASLISLSTLPISCVAFYFGASPYLLSIVFLLTTFINIFTDYYLMKTCLNFPIKQLITSIYFRVLPVVILTLPIVYLDKSFGLDSVKGLIITCCISSIWTMLMVLLLGMNRTEQQTIMRKIKSLFVKC
jgi:O-antigen/teichoic acid export membrane protein